MSAPLIRRHEPVEDVVLFVFPIRPCKVTRISEFPAKFFLVESGILGFRMCYLAQSIRNLADELNPESKFY